LFNQNPGICAPDIGILAEIPTDTAVIGFKIEHTQQILIVKVRGLQYNPINSGFLGVVKIFRALALDLKGGRDHGPAALNISHNLPLSVCGYR
jgi:hypothetical protein